MLNSATQNIAIVIFSYLTKLSSVLDSSGDQPDSYRAADL